MKGRRSVETAAARPARRDDGMSRSPPFSMLPIPSARLWGATSDGHRMFPSTCVRGAGGCAPATCRWGHPVWLRGGVSMSPNGGGWTSVLRSDRFAGFGASGAPGDEPRCFSEVESRGVTWRSVIFDDVEFFRARQHTFRWIGTVVKLIGRSHRCIWTRRGDGGWCERAFPWLSSSMRLYLGWRLSGMKIYLGWFVGNFIRLLCRAFPLAKSPKFVYEGWCGWRGDLNCGRPSCP